LTSNKDRILRELYTNQGGLGHNELREVIHEKSLRRWLPELEKEKLIEVARVRVRGGRKHLHKLTAKGVEYVQRNRLSENFLRTLLGLQGKHPNSINILQDFAQKMLDELYGEGQVFAVFLARNQYFHFQEWKKKNVYGIIRWNGISEEEAK
jgi:DNA-binding PadR family transcriptional regulator